MKVETKKPLSLRRILVPVDFSKNARRALRLAMPLAEKFGARITMLHVVKPMLYPTEMATVVTSVQDTVNATRQHLVELGQKLVPKKLRGEMIVCSGQPYFEIAQIARELQADLIVLTMQAHTGIKRILVGGTAEQVVRHAPCPVLTVRIP